MKHQVRFLECIERDLKSRKETCIKIGIFSVICFILGMAIILYTVQANISSIDLYYLLIFVGSIIMICPVIFVKHFIIYFKRRENKKDWDEILKRYLFDEKIEIEKSTLIEHIRFNGDNLVSNLFIKFLPEYKIKMVITQSEESEREVKLIYILEDETTVSESFICFDNEKVRYLQSVLNIW